MSAVLAGVPIARACGYHDPSSINLGMLNWSYPDALHVRTAVWMAQRDGALSRDGSAAPSVPPAAPMSVTQRLHETALRLAVLRDRMAFADERRPVRSFSMVYIGTLLWTRFETEGDRLVMTAHTSGPANDSVVIVTDEPVIDALLAGQITPQQARQRGLVRFYGASNSIDDIAARFEAMAP